jgi:hypothetical protein
VSLILNYKPRVKINKEHDTITQMSSSVEFCDYSESIPQHVRDNAVIIISKTDKFMFEVIGIEVNPP